MSSSISVIQFEGVKIKSPTILLGLPDAGLVGVIAVSYVIDELGMKELGYVDSVRFPPLVIIKGGIVKNPIRIYGKDNLIAVVSDLPFPPFVVNPFFKSLIAWAKSLAPKTIIGITGIPTQNRNEISKPGVVGIATTSKAKNLLHKAGVKLLNDGVFLGTYAGLIKECNAQNIENITIFAESYANFPDPAASVGTLSVVNEMLGTHIDLKPLEEEVERIKIAMREFMLRTEKTLQSQIMREGTIGPMYG